MSLLLDALKKAAEQKAEKNKQEVPQPGSSDETEIHVAAEDISKLEGGADSGLRQSERALQDQTEIDDSELNTRSERTLIEPDDGTETRLEIPDTTETETRSFSAQMQTGEDETIIFADEDVADFMGEPELVTREPRAPEDETDLSQLAPREDATDVGEVAPRVAGDETDLSQLAPHEDETDVSELMAAPAVGDETDLSQLASREDDTDISQPFPLLDEPGLEPQADAEDETDISVPPASVADLEYAAAQQQAAGADADISQSAEAEDVTDVTDAGDEDMSLLLVERDQTNLTNPTPVSDPQAPQDQTLALQDDSGGADASPGAEDVTQTSTTATTGIASDTQTGVTSRTETTSTRTYAPDNYDRTLMRLPSDDASKLFAGMKSDSDVVMTPEYAKKVFHSKSSAQRLQHYKFYSGIAVVILLAIGIYGLFEFQDQSGNIDASLRPLKNDPMPGIIRPAKEPEDSGLFTEAKINERTLDIIKNADNGNEEMASDTGVIAEESVSDEAVEVAADASVAQAEASGATATPAQTEVAMTAAAPAATIDAPAQSKIETDVATEVSSLAQPAAAGSDSGTASSTLEISSSQRVEQKSTWLREAYAAYQAGNDELAMSLYNKVLEVDPQNRNALLARAAIHVQNGNSRDAIRDYQTLLLANPKDSLAMASLIAVADYSPQDTETQLKLMIRDEPDSPYLNFALANAYGAQNRWQEAQGHYFRALENNPADPNYAYNLAVSLEHISQPGAAISYYRRALDNFNNGLATFSREVVDQRLEMLGKP